MEHSFKVEIAVKYDIPQAILLNNIYFWVEKNRANNKHFYEGRYWTYNSNKAFSELFPYMSQRQINYSLEKLLDNNLILKGNFNEAAYDRTLWYTVSDLGYTILQNCEMEFTNLSNANYKIVKPIPYINTDKKTHIKEIYKERFEKFWNEYPKKKEKAKVEKWFIKNQPNEDLFNTIIEKVQINKNTNDWKKDNGKYIPYPYTWLNNKRWEDEIDNEEYEDVDYLVHLEAIKRGEI